MVLEKVILVGWQPLNREPREATVLSPKSKILFLADAVLCCCYKEAGSSSFFSIACGTNLAAALTRDNSTVQQQQQV